MATIPLYNDGQQRGVPRGAQAPMAPDLSGRLRVDSSGVARAAYEGSHQDKLDPNGFRGDQIAGNAWAQAMENVGGVMGQIANDRLDAKNYTDTLNAEAYLSQQQGEFEKDKQNNLANPDQWGAMWSKRMEGIKKSFDTDKNLAPVVREKLTNHLTRWGASGLVHAESDATQAMFQRADEASTAKWATHIDNGDIESAQAISHMRVEKGWSTPEKEELRLRDGEKKIALKNHQSFLDDLTVASEVHADEAVAHSMIDQQPLSDSEKLIYKNTASAKIAQRKERMIGEAQSNNLGSFVYAKAQGQTIDPLVVDQMVKDGRLEPSAAAGLRKSLRDEQGVSENSSATNYDYKPHLDMESLMTDAMNYDSDDDSTRKGKADLYSRALSLGMSNVQHARFVGVLEDAEKTNADGTGKSKNAEKTYARNMIDYAVKQQAGNYMRPVWDKNLEGALQDEAKLIKMGVPAEKAKKIKEMIKGGASFSPDFTGALREFKSSPIEMKDFSQAEKAGITQWEFNLFRKALSSDAEGNILDEQAKNSGSYLGAKTFQEFEGWYNGQKEKPTPEAMKSWINDKSKAKFQGGANAIFMEPEKKPKTVSDTMSSGGNRITSYGYSSDEWADSASAVGIGAWVPDDEAKKIKAGEASDYKLQANDFATSPDVEEKLRKAGIKPMDKIKMKLSNGKYVEGRWMDRTANDRQAKSLGLPPLRGRWDLYSPNGKSEHDGVTVEGFETIQS